MAQKGQERDQECQTQSNMKGSKNMESKCNFKIELTELYVAIKLSFVAIELSFVYYREYTGKYFT